MSPELIKTELVPMLLRMLGDPVCVEYHDIADVLSGS